MTRRFWKIFGLGLTILFLAFPVWARTFSSSDYILGKREVVSGIFVKQAKKIKILGQVDGDAYLFGSQITIGGQINGDLIAAGGQVKIEGKITGNLRAVAGQIILNGQVGRNASLVGGTIDIGSNSQIGGHLLIAGGEVDFSGKIGEEAKIFGQKVIISGDVGRTLQTKSQALIVSSDARIGGNLIYQAIKARTQISPQAKISGQKIYQRFPPSQRQAFWARGLLIKAQILSYLGMLLVGLFLLRLIPQKLRRLTSQIDKGFWKSCGWGGVALFLVPILGILLIFSIIGGALGFLLLGLWLASIYLAKLIISLWMGLKLFEGRKVNSFLALAVGAFVFKLAIFVPIAGWFLVLLGILAGLGAIFKTGKEYLQKK